MRAKLCTLTLICTITACVTPTRNYVGPFIPIPIPEANLGPDTPNSVLADKIIQLNKDCTTKLAELEKIINKSDDRRTLYNKINGGVTGFLGSIGSAGTMVSGLTASVVMGTDGSLSINGSDKTRTAVIGGITAGITLVGVALTAFLDMGAAQKNRAVDKMDIIAKKINAYTQNCTASPNTANCAQMQGQLESMCTLDK